MKKIILTY